MSIDRAMFILECLNDGIIPPVEDDIISGSPIAYLDELPPEDARKAKRKFRKLHRKIKQEKRKHLEAMSSKKGWAKRTSWRCSGTIRREWVREQLEKLEAEFGNFGDDPNKIQKRKRRTEVMREIWQKIPRT